MTEAALSDLRGIKVGHAQNIEAATGCTVIICEEGAVAGVSVRGGSPGTRETDALDPVHLRKSIHAVLLAGGSAFGLDAAGGIMRYLEERGIGRDVGVARVPIVAGAILFDLKCGDWKVRPDGDMGYAACVDAETTVTDDTRKTTEGNVGAGTGAVVGKICGMERAMKGGLGISVVREGNLVVGAVIAVNCVGDVIDPESGRIVAGAYDATRGTFIDSESFMLADTAKRADFFSGKRDEAAQRDTQCRSDAENTIIGAVITNARLTKAEANRLSLVAHNGIARTVRPAHTSADGDTLFALSTGEVDADTDAAGILAVRAVERAILKAVLRAEDLAGFVSAGIVAKAMDTTRARDGRI